jgi:O-antigen ligase
LRSSAVSLPEEDGAKPEDREARLRFPRTIWIGHLHLGLVELLAVIAGLVVFGDIGWDGPLWDGRLQMILHVIAGVALCAGVVALLRGAAFPRSHLEIPVLVFLVVLGLATILGQNEGLAARALAATIGFACVLPLAVVAIRRRPMVSALVVMIPTLLLAAAILWQLVSRRIGWLSLGIGGLPPVRIASESTAFGSVAVPPFILVGLLPLCMLIRPRRLRLALLAVTFVLLVPLAALSGSRSSWLALGVAALLYIGPVLWRRRGNRLPRLRRGRLVAIGIGVLVLVVGVAFVAPRFTAFSSLLYRERLWSDTLSAWSASPITGVGPGTMPYARQAAAPPDMGPIRQPHSHDLALGVLGDAGPLGLAAAASIVIAFFWFAGPHRSRTARGRAASSVLAGFLVSGLVEDITFLPAFDLVVLALAAIALLDADAVRWTRLRLPRQAPVIAAIGSAALLVPVLLGDLSSVTYRLGTEDVWNTRWSSAVGWYRSATILDPWDPTAPKALSIAADMVGDGELAIASARVATQLNRADGPSWTNLAVLCAEAGDRACALAASEAAARWSPVTNREVINAALIQQRYGNTAAADDLYRRSLLGYLYTGMSLNWPRDVPIDPNTAPAASTSGELALVIAFAVEGQPIIAPRGSDPIVVAVAAAMRGDRAQATAALRDAERREPYEPFTWQIASVLLSHWGEDPTEALAVAAFLGSGPLTRVPGAPPAVTYEIASLHVVPRDQLVRGAERLIPNPPWPWALERFLPRNG